MARPEKQGLDYFPMDTNIFSEDARLRVLVGKFGIAGFGVYSYLLCKCYGDRGYYIEAQDEFYELAACDLGLAEDLVRRIVDFLAQKGLLNAALLRRGILTSHGIQLRYQEAIRKRMSRRKRPMEVVGEYWLLSEDETEDYIRAEGLWHEKPHKEEKRKEEKSKEEERTAKPAEPSPTPTAVYGSFANVELSDQELKTLQERFPDWQQRIERLSAYMASSGKRYGNHFATLVAWAQEDQKKPAGKPFKGLQPPPGDFRQPVGHEPGAFELRAMQRLREHNRAREGA